MAASLPPPDPASRAEPPAGSASTAETAGPARPRRASWVVPLAAAGALLLAGIVVYSLAQGIGDGDDESDRGDATAWNAIATVDRETGAVTVVDRAGTELARIETGIADADLRTISNRQLAVVGDETAAIVDLAEGAVQEVEIPDDLDLMVTRRGPPRPILATPAGGTLLVPVDDGEPVDVAAEAGWEEARLLPDRVVTSPDGSYLAVDDGERNGEAAIVSTADGAVAVVTGLVVAVDRDGVTTLRIDDETSRLEHFDLDGESQGSVELGVRPRTLLDGSDGTVLVITPEGGLVRADPAASESEDVGQLEMDQTVDRAVAVPPSGGSALVVDELDDDRAEVYLVRQDGSVSGPLELPDSFNQVEMGPAEGCLAVSAQSTLTVLRLADAAVVERLEGDGPIGGFVASADRCTVAVFDREPRRVVTPDGLVELSGASLVGLSPDGAWVAVREDPEGDEEPTTLATPLDALDDGAVDPETAVELPGRGPVVFVQHG